ncbi:Pre-mRNA-processing factor 19 [Nakaseomyces bracarensis]|uniref:Pre-mRNA-processing factor 19 n=1 Tax=Nakaseomyces bracarensis TaxID=273131 RepID=A0ABR4NTH7_9SACH
MYCGISGKVPRVPVLSPVSRCVFEKTLVEEYVRKHGRDPVNGKPVTLEQLIPVDVSESLNLVNAGNSATLSTNYSIPSLLSTLQNEWDAVMLENFELRKNVDTLMKKLSTALYERDAAKKVALRAASEQKRLQKELDQVVQQLVSAAPVSDDEEQEEQEWKKRKVSAALAVVDSNFSDDLLKSSIEYLQETKPLLKQSNIKRVKDIKLATIENRSPEQLSDVVFTSLLKADRLKSMALYKNATVDIIDGSGEKTSEDVSSLLQAENKIELAVPGPEKCIIMKLLGNKIGVYNADTNKMEVSQLEIPDGREIIYLYSHESVKADHCLWVDNYGDIGYLSLDGKQDVRIKRIEEESIVRYSIAHLHKDGVLLALGNETAIEIFNLSQPEEKPIVFNIGSEIPQGDKITDVKFCSNGFFLIVEVDHSSLLTYDLRKPQKDIAAETVDIEGKKWDFDITGKYLVLANIQNESEVELSFFQYVKNSKKWNPIDTKKLTLDEKVGNELSSCHLLSNGSSSSILLSLESKIVDLTIESN